MKITFMIEEWRHSTKGGRSTLMRQMAIELSRLENVEVSILIPSASPEDKEDAQRYNIKVFEPQKYPGYEPVDCLQFPPQGFSTDFIIGYGIKPGCHGQLLKKNLRCKWIHMVLRNARETVLFQKTPGVISKGQEQYETEIKLCKKADMVLTIGSKLDETFNSALSQCTGAFGLTALEALSAGVPILITQNSGLAEALEEVPSGHGCILGQAADWAEQIKRVQKHLETRLKGARMLCNNYKEKYCWMDQCAAFVTKLRALHSGHAEEMQQGSRGKRHSARKQVAGHAVEMQQESQGKRSSPRKRVAGHAVEIQQESQGHAVEMQQESQGKRSSPRKRVAGDAEEMQQEFQSKRGSLRKQVAGHAEEMQQESQGKRSSPRKKVAGHTEEMQQESQGKRSSPRKRLTEGVVTDDDLQTLGKAIGGKWDQLARRLPGITEDDIEGIELKYDNLPQRGFHMLRLWKTNNGEAADYKTLYDALIHDVVQRKDLAEKYCFK